MQPFATRRRAGANASFIFSPMRDCKDWGLGVGGRSAQVLIDESLKPILIGQDPLTIEKLWDDMFWRVRGEGRKGLAFGAISGVDTALWDLKAKYFNVPLYKLLGAYTDTVPIYGSGGWTHFSVDELVAEQTGYVERGMKSVKMKVGKDFGKSEKEDIERLAAVREAVGDNVEILIDANNGYYAKQAIRMAREFEPYNVGWFEEPVLADDIEGLAAVAAAIDIPVATGEHEYTKFGFRELIARGGADIVQPDIGRVGGVTEWIKVANLAHAFNLPVAPHAFRSSICMSPALRLICASSSIWVCLRSSISWSTPSSPNQKTGCGRLILISRGWAWN